MCLSVQKNCFIEYLQHVFRWEKIKSNFYKAPIHVYGSGKKKLQLEIVITTLYFPFE